MATSSSAVAPIQRRPVLLILGPVLVIAAIVAFAIDRGLPFACFALLGFPIGLCVCLVGLFFRPRWPHALGLLVGLSAVGYVLLENNRLASGHLRPSDYPQMLQLASGGTSHFPRTIPANATDVRITAFGPYGAFPAQDFMIDLRYILPIADAKLVLAQAEKTAITADPTTHGANQATGADQFIQKHGGNPADFQSHLLVIPNGGMNAGGISVNAATGEVIYWVYY
ncbi:MAG: hypothetical protein JNM86_15495 [Phycisphaerae bacterium]|nr:hypothetical protein [Phycisphaerae bacterium]